MDTQYAAEALGLSLIPSRVKPKLENRYSEFGARSHKHSVTSDYKQRLLQMESVRFVAESLGFIPGRVGGFKNVILRHIIAHG